MTPEYHFVTHWRVRGTCGEVADVLGDPLTLTRWWPAVYLEVRELSPGGPNGIGRRVQLRTKGWLPYTLTWESAITESRYPYGFTIAASGDLQGRGVWTFEPDGADVTITYDWCIRAEKPVIRTFSALLRPLFEANHRWAMRQGAASLQLELARRRATSDDAKRAIGPPPGPITFTGIALIGGGVVAAAAAVYLVRRAVRRGRR